MPQRSIKFSDLLAGFKGLATGQRHVFVLQSLDVDVADVGDEHFNTDSAVLLPAPASDDPAPAAPGDADPPPPRPRSGLMLLASCYAHADDHKDKKILITGHTDRAGSSPYNLTLSQLRADNVRCALAGDKDGWAAIADKRHRVADYQIILGWVAGSLGWDCDPGAADNVEGPKTRAALKAFQDRYNTELDASIDVSGKIGLETWGAFFDVYGLGLQEIMEVDSDGLDSARSSLKFVDDGHRAVGCGEFHPAVPTADGVRNVANRRVEVLFFASGDEPKFDCHPSATTCQPSKCEIYDHGRYAFTPVDPNHVKRKGVVSIEWQKPSARCSDDAAFDGIANGMDGESLDVTVQQRDGDFKQTVQAPVADSAITGTWTIKDLLPPTVDGHLAASVLVDALAEKKKSPEALEVKFVNTLTKVTYAKDRDHFELAAEDAVLTVSSDIKFVPGWAASVVKLGARVPAGTGGLLDGQLTWNGYRWMKAVGVKNKYWNGTVWKDLPAGFVLQDSNNFCVGFYKNGASFTCQYGGNWPESFTAWNIDAASKQNKITAWKDNIESTWTGKFVLKRKECKSTKKECCRFTTKAKVKFSKQAAFATGMLIIADGNIRSNDSLFFLDEPRIAMAAHEFGHHIGNPDEYAGAAVDTTMNGDGAVNGIDADSIMGQNLTKVKKRHYTLICKVLADSVKAEHKVTYTYEAVPP
jgi:hypothetical protein